MIYYIYIYIWARSHENASYKRNENEYISYIYISVPFHPLFSLYQNSENMSKHDTKKGILQLKTTRKKKADT